MKSYHLYYRCELEGRTYFNSVRIYHSRSAALRRAKECAARFYIDMIIRIQISSFNAFYPEKYEDVQIFKDGSICLIDKGDIEYKEYETDKGFILKEYRRISRL